MGVFSLKMRKFLPILRKNVFFGEKYNIFPMTFPMTFPSVHIVQQLRTLVHRVPINSSLDKIFKKTKHQEVKVAVDKKGTFPK